MIIPLTLLAAAATGSSQPPASLDELYAAFGNVCVAHTELVDQQKAARARPDIRNVVQLGMDKASQQRQFPETVFFTPTLQIGNLGFSNASSCFVAAQIDSAIGAEAFRNEIAARFHATPNKFAERNDFYHGGWTTGSRTIELDWKRRDGKVTAVLSIRRRDGFAK